MYTKRHNLCQVTSALLRSCHYSSIPGHIKSSHPCQEALGFHTRHCHLQFLWSMNVTNHELLFIP